MNKGIDVCQCFKSQNVFLSNLFPLPSACLKLEQCRRCRISPFRQEHDERERLARILKQPLEVPDDRVHQLLAEGGVGLETAAVRLEV